MKIGFTEAANWLLCSIRVLISSRPGVNYLDDFRFFGVVGDDGEGFDQVRHGHYEVALETIHCVIRICIIILRPQDL